MLELDFALLNLINRDKKGLAYQKFFLDRLPPFFYSPRLEKLIDLPLMQARGCQIEVPMGQGNWQAMIKNRQEMLLQRSISIIDEYHVNTLAVDRRLKPGFIPIIDSYPVTFGDSFIKALALVLIKEILSRHSIDKIIMIGELDYYPEFIEELSRLGVPVSLQSFNPGAYEIMFYRLVYERGCAVSNSCICPENWGKGDLVIVFDQADELLVNVSGIFSLHFNNQTRGISAELENELDRFGLEGRLYNLAPVLETSILAKAGISGGNSEPEKANNRPPGKLFLEIMEAGSSLGIWDLFLDKGV